MLKNKKILLTVSGLAFLLFMVQPILAETRYTEFYPDCPYGINRGEHHEHRNIESQNTQDAIESDSVVCPDCPYGIESNDFNDHLHLHQNQQPNQPGYGSNQENHPGRQGGQHKRQHHNR